MNAYTFVASAPETAPEARCWELLVNGEHTEWTMYELRPAALLYPRGAFGFIDGNQELQFPTLETAQAARAEAWERTNGTRSIT